MTKWKLILKSHYSLGDIVLMTAAVRDLHRCYPKQFITDVRTSCQELWDYNPYLTPLKEIGSRVQTIKLGYPLINFSDLVPYHAIHGYIDSLNEKLGLEIHGTEFKGDIHLADAERSAPSPVAEVVGREIPYWVISAGGKHDLSIKWWDFERYQEVVEHFRGRIQFVQIGANGDFHPKLKGAIDLRGKTSIRQLIRLVHHSQGVLCGVTGLMHLAAAVETRDPRGSLRPCVVIAGGREPAHWEAYPHHQYIHNIGALSCCAKGGCWKARAVPLGDGDDKDKTPQLCTNTVQLLPRCMDMISTAEVVRRIESYFDGGAVRYMSRFPARLGTKGVAATRLNAFDHQQLNTGIARATLERVARHLPEYAGGHDGKGIVICAGGTKYFTGAWVCLNMLRRLGCRLPVQFWHLGSGEMDERMKSLIAPLNATCVDALEIRKKHPARILRGWELKAYAILHAPFQELLLLDADNVPVADPSYLFDTPEFHQTGALFWPDIPSSKMTAQAWHLCGLQEQDERPFETGQIVLSKQRCWRQLQLTMWFNEHSDFWHPYTLGDKETFHLAWRKLGATFAMPQRSPRLLPGTMCQHDFQGRLLFQHRNTAKWSLSQPNPNVRGFQFENECLAYLDQLRARWDTIVGGEMPPRMGPKSNNRLLNGEPDLPRIATRAETRKRLATRLRLR